MPLSQQFAVHPASLPMLGADIFREVTLAACLHLPARAWTVSQRRPVSARGGREGKEVIGNRVALGRSWYNKVFNADLLRITPGVLERFTSVHIVQT